MIEHKEFLYAITQLTNDGQRILMSDNLNFDFTGFLLIDDEINYNLVNKDQKTTKGFDRLDFFADDAVSDIQSLPIMLPEQKFDTPRKFLFGDYTTHFLKPEQIKTENDLVRDMAHIPIVEKQELVAARNHKEYEFDYTVVSGNVGTLEVLPRDLQALNVSIDFAGSIVKFEKDGTRTTFTESTGVFEKIQYNVSFVGSGDNHFEFNVETQPSTPYILSVAKIVADRKLNFNLFGTFRVYKTFAYNGFTFITEVVKIELVQKEEVGKIVLDGHASALESYLHPYVRKEAYINFNTYTTVNAQLTSDNYLLNQVVSQVGINGYISLDKYVSFTVRASQVNKLHFRIQNALNLTHDWHLISMDGVNVRDTLLMTAPEVNMSFTTYRVVGDSNVYLITVPDELPTSIGYLKADDVLRGFYTFEGTNWKWIVDINSSIKATSTSDYYQTNGSYSLLHLYCVDHNMIVNYDFKKPIVQSNYEKLVFFL